MDLMTFFFFFSLFVFGLCAGSFLNVVVYRSNHPEKVKKIRGVKAAGVIGSLKIFGGRSFCPKCKKQIAWRDNLPLLSFVLLHGRCRWCHSPISRQYPLVELVTTLAWLGVGYWWRLGVVGGMMNPGSVGAANWMSLPYYLFLVSCLIAIFVSDFLYMTIPDEVVWPAIVAAGAWGVLGFSGMPLTLIALAGMGAAGLFWLLHSITKGRGMGFGDVKLALLIGLALGFTGTMLALFIAFLTGAVVGVILILIGKKRFGQQIAFGPFLVAGALTALFWGESLWREISRVLLW